MNRNTTRIQVNAKTRDVLTGIRRHPMRAAAICVPLIAVSVFTGTSMASAQPAVTLDVPAAALNAAPAQHVMIYDNQLTGRKVTGMNSKAAVKMPANEDGCDPDYGAPNQCVPWKIPAASPKADCAWLRSNGFGPLKIVGTNRQDLPVTIVNGVSYACE
jgi:hypothetical protein